MNVVTTAANIQQQLTDVNVGVFSDVNDPDNVAVQEDVQMGGPGVHAGFSDLTHDAEMSSYFRDSGSHGYLSPTPSRATLPFADIRPDSQQLQAASHRQLRSASRQSAASVRRADVHSRASDRMSTNSQLAADPLVELMRNMIDN